MSISSREPEALSRDPQALLQRLEWTVIRRLDGLLHGDYRTLFRGFGLDLADLREYQFNDDVRRIDWNVTARMQTPYVREYHEDREVSAWFLVDLSGSIGFGSGAQTKHMLTVDFVAVMARLLSGHGNAVGAMCYGQRVDQVLAARTGRRHVLHLMQQLQARGQPLSASRQGARSPQPRGTGTATDLGELLRAAAKLIKRRSLVFVVSDFISEPGWASALSQLSQRHEVVAIRIHDPLESRLPDLGLVTIEDAETGEQRVEVSPPRDRHGDITNGVFENEGPPDDPCHDFTECGIRIRVGAAGLRNHGGEFGVAERRQPADRAEQHEREHQGWARAVADDGPVGECFAGGRGPQ
jgi:uncharacterized protein (DUF58 family)